MNLTEQLEIKKRELSAAEANLDAANRVVMGCRDDIEGLQKEIARLFLTDRIVDAASIFAPVHEAIDARRPLFRHIDDVGHKWVDIDEHFKVCFSFFHNGEYYSDEDVDENSDEDSNEEWDEDIDRSEWLPSSLFRAELKVQINYDYPKMRSFDPPVNESYNLPEGMTHPSPEFMHEKLDEAIAKIDPSRLRYLFE